MKTALFSSTVGDVAANLAFVNNFDATTSPGVGNGSSQGYQSGSRWVNTATGACYTCSDPTVGAAVWSLDGDAGIDPTELGYLNGASPGVMVASKAAVYSSGGLLPATTLQAGKDAVAGAVDIYPVTTARGKTHLTAAANTGATTTEITTAAQAGARTYTVPDAGASASFAMSEGAQTLNGVKTFGSAPVMSGASITAASVPNTALAANGGLAALIGAGLGASISYTKTATGTNTLLASVAGDRSVIIVVVVDQIFANGDGAQPTFQIGQTGTAAKFADTSAFTNAAAGAVKTFAGTLTGTDNLIVTAVAGTGTTETGGITVTVLALPV